MKSLHDLSDTSDRGADQDNAEICEIYCLIEWELRVFVIQRHIIDCLRPRHVDILFLVFDTLGGLLTSTLYKSCLVLWSNLWMIRVHHN